MDNFLNEQTVRIIDNKFYHFLNNILPGIFVMEIFFKKGLFSHIPQTIYEFLIYIVWCFLFSIPYNSFKAFSFYSIFEKMKSQAEKDDTIDYGKFKLEFDKFVNENKEKNDKADSVIAFMYIFIYLFLTYFTYKILTYFFVYYPILKMNTDLLIFINTFFFICVIYLILVRPITNYLENRIVNRKS